MLIYIDDREDEVSEDNYGYDYGDDENPEYDYDIEQKSYDSTENKDNYFS